MEVGEGTGVRRWTSEAARKTPGSFPAKMEDELLLLFGSRALKLGGRCAQRFGNILVGCKTLEVLRIQHRQHVQGDVQGSLGIVDEIAHNYIVFAKRAIACNQPKNFVGEAGHGRESFDFLIGQAWGLQDGPLDDLVGVADERAPRVGTAFNGILHALGHRHFGDALDQGLPALGVGFRGDSGVG